MDLMSLSKTNNISDSLKISQLTPNSISNLFLNTQIQEQYGGAAINFQTGQYGGRIYPQL
jgi:hypothetical protein